MDNFHIDNPILTVLVVLGSLAGIIFLLGHRYPGLLSGRTNRSTLASAAAAPSAPAPAKPAPAKPVSAPSSNLLKTGIKLIVWGAVLAGVYFLIALPTWKFTRDYLGKDHTPSVQSAAGMVKRQEEAASAAPAECTAPSQKATVTGPETVWIDVARHCLAHPDPAFTSGLYDLSCKDLNGVEHEWNDTYCWNYTALGFRKKPGDASEPDPVPSSKPFVIHISFTTVP